PTAKIVDVVAGPGYSAQSDVVDGSGLAVVVAGPDALRRVVDLIVVGGDVVDRVVADSQLHAVAAGAAAGLVAEVGDVGGAGVDRVSDQRVVAVCRVVVALVDVVVVDIAVSGVQHVNSVELVVETTGRH